MYVNSIYVYACVRIDCSVLIFLYINTHIHTYMYVRIHGLIHIVMRFMQTCGKLMGVNFRNAAVNPFPSGAMSAGAKLT